MQQTLFDRIIAHNRIYIADEFVSDGFMVIRVDRDADQDKGLVEMVEQLTDPNYGEPARLVAEIPPTAGLSRAIVFAPADADPPYIDMKQLTLINAELFELIAISADEIDDEDLKIRLYRHGGVVPAIAVYDDHDELVGGVAGLHVDRWPEILEVLANQLMEKNHV